MSRFPLEPLDVATASEPLVVVDRAAWLHACFAPAESLLETDIGEDGGDPGWRPIAFWWPTSIGVQLVLMPCRSLVQ